MIKGIITTDELERIKHKDERYAMWYTKKGKRVVYISCVDYIRSQTDIRIEYKGKTMFTCCFTGILTEGLVKEYARDMIQILLDKEVIK